MKAPENLAKWFSLVLAGIALSGAIMTGVNSLSSTIDSLATKDDIQVISDEVEELREIVTGADQILQFKPGYTYVREPVYRDDVLEYNAVVRRTVLGLSCTAESYVPIYEDARHALISGDMAVPHMQFGNAYQPLSILLAQPEGLEAGRITVLLQITYDCNGASIIQNTEPVAFILTEREP